MVSERPHEEAAAEDDVYVGCVCQAGKVWVGGRPYKCQHCGGSGSIPRHKYRELTVKARTA